MLAGMPLERHLLSLHITSQEYLGLSSPTFSSTHSSILLPMTLLAWKQTASVRLLTVVAQPLQYVFQPFY